MIPGIARTKRFKAPRITHNSPLSNSVQIFAKYDTQRIKEVMALWNLHALSTPQAAARLRNCIRKQADAKHIHNMLQKERNNSLFIQDWRLAALRRGVGHPRWEREILDLDARTGFIDRAKPIRQDLNPANREKLLADELRSMRHHIKSLASASSFIFFKTYWNKQDVEEKLTERAIQAFRWTYPFVDYPGKVMTTAIKNYMLNIKRDAFSTTNAALVSMENEGLANIIDRDSPVYDEELPVNQLTEVIQSLEDKYIERLYYTLTNCGVERFAHMMSEYMDASPNKIMKLMKYNGWTK